MSIEVDLVFINGKVITVDPQDTIAEAVAVIGNKIVKVGTSEEIEPLAVGNTKKIDLNGRTLVPGFIDAHMHYGGRPFDPRVVDVQCPPMKSIKEVIQAVEKKVQESPEGEWIIGRVAYSPDHNVIEKRYITRWELDKVAPDNPVILPQHTSVANSKALELAGITKDTPDPPGGKIWKDPETGEPDGRLTERAGKLVRKLIPSLPEDVLLEALKKGAIQHGQWLLEQGITTVHSPGPANAMTIRSLLQLSAEGRLPLRVLAAIRMIEGDFTLEMLTDLGLENSFGNEWFKITGIKMSVGGGMTGKAAKMYEHYVDEPDNYGVIRIPQDQLNYHVYEAQKAGLRSFVHAIGDEDLDMTIKSFEYTLEKSGEKDLAKYRHRIEHGGNNFNTPKRLEKIKKLGIILASNPHFIWRLADGYKSYIGEERMKDSYRFKTILDMGIRMTAGADANYPPLEGIECCVTHMSRGGDIFTPDERITPLRALRLFTMDNAYGGFEEDIKGSIEVGKLADMVVLSDNPLTVPSEKIMDINIDMTIIDGKIVYERL